MTVTITKPKFNLRDTLNSLKKRTGLFGEQIMRAETATDFYNLVGQNRNRIINGAMVIDQRNAGASVTTSALQAGVYTVDRWSYYNDVISKRTIQQSSVAPPGFKTSLKVTVIATDTVGPQQFIRQAIEGYNLADLNWGTANAQPAVLSFWVRSSIVGQHGGAIQNVNTDQVYPIAYTINVADTWEYKTITISGPTSGTWSNTTNGLNASVQFENGPGYQKAPANVWIAQNATSSIGSVNLCATNGATWYITGIQLEKGTVATPFEYRSFGTELALCQRYFESNFSIGTAPAINVNFEPTNIGSIAYYTTATRTPPIVYKVTKRVSPTITLYSPHGYAASSSNTFNIFIGGVWYNWSAGAPNSNNINYFNIEGTSPTAVVAGSSYLTAGNWAVTSEI